MNVITVCGRLTKDAVLRRTGDGDPVSGFSVASDIGYGEKKSVIYFDCSLWGKRGETLSEYLTKATQVTVIGELSVREYESKTYLQIRVGDIALQGSANSQGSANPAQKPAQADSGGFNDPIPF